MTLLERLFKPKTQKNDPQARLKRLQNLPPDDPSLAEFAQQDAEPNVRCAAVERLTDFQLLQRISQTDSSLSVKEAAAARFRALLAGTTTPPAPLQERLSKLPSLDTELINHLAHHAKEAELRLAALERIEDETFLAQAAINDHTASVRLAALERVHQSAALEEIVQHSRNRDKRVYRTARERLDTIRAEQQRTERVLNLCQEMENLSWDGESGVNAARFPKLELEWQELLATADKPVQERYEQARMQFLAHRQEGVEKRIARQEVCSVLEACAERLQTEPEWTSELATTLQKTLQEAQQTWEQCGTIENDSEGQRIEQRYKQNQHIIQEREKSLQRAHDRAERLRQVLRNADTLQRQASQVLDTELNTLKKQWASLERPDNRQLMQQLQGEFDTALDKLKMRLQRQGERQDQEWQELTELADTLEKALDDGELQHALDVYEKARQRLRKNIGLSRQQMTTVDARLQACVPRLGELRGWRRWGTHQAREHLCEEAENLRGVELPPLEIAERIKQVRAAWKKLDSTEGAASRTLWKRFDKACEQAYEPCQAYFAAKTRERQHNLTQKQAVCEQLEHFESETDWSRINWRDADRLLRDTQKRWHKIGPINRADKKSLDRRFETALKRLDKHLQAEREREIKRRQALITHVKELANNPDIQVAVNAAKRAQAEWQPTVQALRWEEQALWQQFRTACDAVFARRQEEQQAADEERNNNLTNKEALCEAIETLIAEDTPDIEQLRARLRQAREEWKQIGQVPKTALKVVESRFETAGDHVETRIQALQQQATRQEIHNLRERARLCTRLEELLYTPSSEAMTVVEAARSKWQRLPSLPTALAGPIQERFDAVCQALTEDGATHEALMQQLESNLEEKHQLCLRIEILAGVESPPEFAQARMECQVSRLSESLIHREGNKAQDSLYDEARRLEESWYALGIPSTQDAQISERFNQALTKLNS
ncbi:MAG: DUF349 domain-containing protein [Candidatus Competibacteraceae bacterium]|jgi:hypothetical protein|nr:DUF349 domain-containing protein [Candidatus Competibacteraceae bacterium]